MGSSDRDIDENEFAVLTTKLNDNTEMRGIGFRVKILVLFAILLAVVTIICSFLMATRGSRNMIAKKSNEIIYVGLGSGLDFNIPILQSSSTIHVFDDNKNTVLLPEIALYGAVDESEATKISTVMDKQIEIRISVSPSPAEKIISAGEAVSTTILSGAYSDSERKEFCEFVQAFDALRIAFDEANETDSIK